MELICGACHGRLLAELPGTTVSCPHCGTHLQTPAAEPVSPAQAAVVIESGDGSPSGPDPETDTVRLDFWVPPSPEGDPATAEPFTFLPAGAAGSMAPGDAARPSSVSPGLGVGVPEALTAVESASPVSVAYPAADNAHAMNPAGEAGHSADEQVGDPLKTTVAGFVVDVAKASTSSPAGEHEASIAPMPGAVPSNVNAARQSARAGVSPMAFVIVISYASAMTLACLYLAFLLLTNPRTLDLPDLAPPKPKDKKSVTTVIYVSPDQEVPSANVLKLGESRQYGSLKVTPLRVTRGRLNFEYYQSDAGQQREPEGPVLKLHLRFENVSRNQEFIPLDSRLVFTKKVEVDGSLKANNFVCNVSDRKNPDRLVFIFDLTPNGNWLLKGQNLDREFEPGQVLDTFIPTAPEQIDALSGDLVWRVHFRKGYNRASLRGVTTLIEVLFRESDIADE